MGVPESWEEGRAEMEEERQKCREIEAHQGGWRESNLKVNRWQRGGMGDREKVEDRHSRRAEMRAEKGRCRKK